MLVVQCDGTGGDAGGISGGIGGGGSGAVW